MLKKVIFYNTALFPNTMYFLGVFPNTVVINSRPMQGPWRSFI